MPWQQLICQSTREHQEKISALMEQYSALSISLEDAADQPILEPLPGEAPLWDKIIITALYDENDNLLPIVASLNSKQLQWEINNISVSMLEDQVWERVWMKDFHPMRFGKNLWIYPTEYELPDDDSIKILLDPGLAFGTGTHPTTALCLEWLDQNPPVALNVMDYGCGSGILAIAAAKLGAKHIIATDIDPQAILATQNNMMSNEVADSMISRYLPEDCPSIQVDLLMANILSGPLVELYPTFDSLTHAGSKLVLSGILAEQKTFILETYAQSFEQLEVKELDGWVRINGIKKSLQT